MKKIILIVALLVAVGGYAQDWYQNGQIVCVNGITYNVKRSQYTVSLGNATNVLTDDSNLRFKSGRLASGDEIEGVDATLVSPEGLMKAFAETFTEEEWASLTTLKDSPLLIYYTISSEGDILEVFFNFYTYPEMLAIPPLKFALLENNLKKYVKWKVNAYGQQMEFSHCISFIKFSTSKLIRESLSDDGKLPKEVK